MVALFLLVSHVDRRRSSHQGQELGDVSKTDLATACGYVSKKKDGSDRVNFTAFYEALLNAKGIDLGGEFAGIGKGDASSPHRHCSRQWQPADR